MNYEAFLKNKAIVSEDFGFEPLFIPDMAMPHQKDICEWSLRGGRRAIFASFGLGKTFMQLIIALNCIKKENKPFLIACPLGVVGEFKRDNRKLKTGYEIQYITDTDSIENYEPKIYITNYERIRKGDIDASKFSGVSFDEASILRNLMEKWQKHNELQEEMIALVREYGLNTNLIKSQMERQIFKLGDKVQIGSSTLYNNDCVIAMDDVKEDYVDLILTSIPFGDHYEYSDNYNDFGHNDGNEEFFKQMDFLTPKLLKSLKPGHVAAIHVKDRIRYSYQNGTSFTTIDDFSGETVRHFRKHGFYLMGKITVTTDVVAENNQTYRLGWSEQCKDATKMGVGLPEYVLLFRKAPTHMDNAYADEPVMKYKNPFECPSCNTISESKEWKKEEDLPTHLICPSCNSAIRENQISIPLDKTYPVDLWQLDAHAYWRSSGNKLMPLEHLMKYDLKQIIKLWKKYQKEGLYDFEVHKQVSKSLDDNGKLSRKFMTVPPISNSEMVWDDISRTKTLNAKQVSSKKEKHICPLQLDIIERLINRFTNKGDVVLDPFGGLFSTAYQAMKMGRKSISIELNSEYYKDGLFYMKCIHNEINAPTLFDILELDKTA